MPMKASTTKRTRKNWVNSSTRTKPLNDVYGSTARPGLAEMTAMTRPVSATSESARRRRRPVTMRSVMSTKIAVSVTASSGTMERRSFMARASSSADRRERSRFGRELHDARDRGVDDVEDRLRVHAEDDGEHGERQERGDLDPVEVGQRAVGLTERPVHH